MSMNPWAAIGLQPIGFASIKWDATPNPIYATADNGNKIAGGVVAADTAIVKNGTGDMTITLSRPFSEKQTQLWFSFRGAYAASELKTPGWVAASSTTIRITTGQEGAGGAASALANVPFDVIITEMASVPPL